MARDSYFIRNWISWRYDSSLSERYISPTADEAALTADVQDALGPIVECATISVLGGVQEGRS